MCMSHHIFGSFLYTLCPKSFFIAFLTYFFIIEIKKKQFIAGLKEERIELKI